MGRCWVGREPANVRQFALGVSRDILKANANLLSVCVIYPSPQVNMLIILQIMHGIPHAWEIDSTRITFIGI